MRIIAGKLKSRRIQMVPTSDTRETSDKVRGAVFNSIGIKVQDSYILDLFAGSGSYGLEAISRGAKHVVFNDVKQIALNTIDINLESLGIKEQSTILKLDYLKALTHLNSLEFKLDIAFIDPPYKMDVYEYILNKLYPNLNPGGLVVLELDSNKKINLEDFKQYDIIKEKKYGSKKIIILEKH